MTANSVPADSAIAMPKAPNQIKTVEIARFIAPIPEEIPPRNDRKIRKLLPHKLRKKLRGRTLEVTKKER